MVSFATGQVKHEEHEETTLLNVAAAKEEGVQHVILQNYCQ